MERSLRAKSIVSYAVDSSDTSDDDLLDSDMEEAAEVTTSRLRLKNLNNNGSPNDIDKNMEERLLSRCRGGHISPENGVNDDEEGDELDVSIVFRHKT